ncbi:MULTISPECIES: hypothetical protein [unclassified Flammeovirga]|uniref:hypothetical protein n=1 Tax=unclassified Flammeovirga TaxID=2637820 RepID=UPI0005C457D9|nr:MULTISPECIES: hypothetical protein [unclassified Flammeovirga]MBD0401718.1 hypothetical protein [Flammeovirga sp. EKP202]
MKLTTERLSSLLITSALFGTNIELSEKDKSIITIESPVPQHNLSTFDELKDKITGIAISELMSGKEVLNQLVPSTLDLSFVSTGNYILSIKMKSGEISRKMCVQQLGNYNVVRA